MMLRRWFAHEAMFHGRDDAVAYAEVKATRTGLPQRVYLDRGLLLWVVSPR